jgi:hypothetical protein
MQAGRSRVPAPRSHEPQASLRGDVVNPHVPQPFCGLCGSPHVARDPALKLMH